MKSFLSLFLFLFLTACVAKPTMSVPADVASVPDDAMLTSSGLASKVVREGNGKTHPNRNSKVVVHYTGWTTDGKQFDTSEGGEPISFFLTQVIPGWTEGLQLMVVGEKRRFWIPAKLAYEKGGGPQGTLVFDVELFSFQ